MLAAVAVAEIHIEGWRILSTLGTGGMGEVLLGENVANGRAAALKVMNAQTARDERETARFLREANIARQLRHPAIVRVDDTGRTREGRPYLVMELLRGEPLDVRLRREGALPPGEVVALLTHACNALAYAHAAGVVHRDIKPSNLFIVDDAPGESLKILDFGLARWLGDDARITAPATAVGTPKYMSPEQIQGRQDIDTRSDLWSLAVVAFRMLTGSHPLDPLPSGLMVLERIMNAPIPPPSRINAALPPTVDAWAARALDRDRSRRFQTPGEFVQALRNALPNATLAAPRTLRGSVDLTGLVPEDPSLPSALDTESAPAVQIRGRNRNGE